MSDQLQVLRKLLADGKTRQVIEQLLPLTAADRDQHNEVLQISAQFSEIERQTRLNVGDPKLLGTERNRVNAALFGVMENLSGNGGPLKRSWNIRKIIVWIGVLAVLAGATGYALRGYFRKPDPVPVQVPAPQVEKPAESLAQPQSKPTTSQPGKSNPNITVKDKAKVGIISTGDSVTINAKQDF
ncbi:MAG: hypothetical protein IT262_10845 [Saprospiraceae bacterium]|nr:hypothetical protein [Saprospiraceae bacterium]